jgi:hypothetical protein
MKMTRFELTIKMGNEAMKSKQDIVYALKEVTKKMQGGNGSGIIMDINGY